ncbi:MAG: hypothetical protein GX275_05435 [Clostridiales bacterium]|nr:hypothetical protein [Clostridiales bacterium]
MDYYSNNYFSKDDFVKHFMDCDEKKEKKHCWDDKDDKDCRCEEKKEKRPYFEYKECKDDKDDKDDKDCHCDDKDDKDDKNIHREIKRAFERLFKDFCCLDQNIKRIEKDFCELKELLEKRGCITKEEKCLLKEIAKGIIALKIISTKTQKNLKCLERIVKK